MQNKQKWIAIDFGTKTIGIAITDYDLKFCLPYTQINNDPKKYQKIWEIIKEENINKIILGYPKMQNNYVSQRHSLIVEFQKELNAFLNYKVPIILFDEAYSSVNAIDSLRQYDIKTSKIRKNKDMLAATIILENYLQFIKNAKE
ncbi:MAG: Holliday junction resolvase RuvX [Malacoplasma sp.]|nr:Holliday junction resolvase RuvX [Malacoplasma sp.]